MDRAEAIKRYRKKPVVVEAVQWDGKNKVEIQLFVGRYLDEFAKGLKIPTLEGDMFASVGDYIIKGAKGEFYPCKPDIFKQTYEAVDQPQTNADRIRAMTDEELMKLLLKVCTEDICPNGCENCNGDCEGRILDWLQQPAEESAAHE